MEVSSKRCPDGYSQVTDTIWESLEKDHLTKQEATKTEGVSLQRMGLLSSLEKGAGIQVACCFGNSFGAGGMLWKRHTIALEKASCLDRQNS